jgi:hypothetical protein
MDTFARHHPAAKIHIWDLESFESILRQDPFLSTLGDVWDANTSMHARADIARACIIWKYGGLYADLDFICIRPMPLFDQDFIIFTEPDAHNALLGIDYPYLVMMGLFYASIPHHPVIHDVLIDIRDDPTWCKGPYANLCLAGPVRWTRVMEEKNHRALVLPSPWACPIANTNRLSTETSQWDGMDKEGSIFFTLWGEGAYARGSHPRLLPTLDTTILSQIMLQKTYQKKSIFKSSHWDLFFFSAIVTVLVIICLMIVYMIFQNRAKIFLMIK